MKETKIRSIIKGISWRLVGTADTIVISYIITGNITKAFSIGAAEILSKLFFYYIHERIWLYFTKGRTTSRIKSFTKALTWRMTGTLDTIIISFIIISLGREGHEIANPFYKASAIGSIELFTKVFFFYIHERVWNKLEWGRREG